MDEHGRTVDRRTVLRAAVAATAGVGVSRLVALAGEPAPSTVAGGGAQAARPGLDWISPLGDEGARVGHLLRRATFGATAAELEQARSDGYAKTVERLVETGVAEPPALAGADEASAAKPLPVGRLQQWWIQWMLVTPTPFAERMTLFWHGHFTSDFRKVTTQSPYLYWQNRTWRAHALGDLGTLLHQVTVDPAMLRYLDLGSSDARDPNENYARELMELFTMGPGAYTEDDVKAAARALAGWREPLTQPMIDALAQRAQKRGAPARRLPSADPVKTGVRDPRRAYRGPAFAYLGEARVWDTESVLAKILADDATAPFVTRKVLAAFATPAPSDAYVARLAGRFRRSGYDLKTLMRDVFRSPEFTAPAAYRALVKSPTEYMVSVAKALGGTALARVVAASGQGMGQTLFDPPSVAGWPENGSWISSNTMLARANFVTQATAAVKRPPSPARAHETLLDSTLSSQTLALLNAAPSDQARWAAVFLSPEFQLK